MANGGDPGYHRAVSLHLARTLDEIGLNKLTVKKRRDMHLFGEQTFNVYDRLTGENDTAYHFGSQTEGATTPGTDSDLDTLACLDKIYHFGSQTEGATTLGMNSDVDTLICLNAVNVIEDWVDWQQGKANLLMLHENTAPGYCRLQVLRPDVPMAGRNLPHEHCTYDSSGRVILKNTVIHSLVQGHDSRNGPAVSRSGRSGFIDTDNVYALRCSTWPVQAAEFTRRRRRHGWPSQRLLEEVVSHGVFLVPVGYKLSPTEPLEWRISASLAERCLMLSLNIVHIKCYVVLKFLIKTFIDPHIRKCISSYHCKTALLHCTEITEPDFWREDNLLRCIMRCLEILQNWVSDLFCPQFMISEENLFAGKVTVHNRDLLLSILTELIRSDGCSLLQVKMDSLGHKLQARINTEPSCEPVVDSIASVMLTGQFERDRQEFIGMLIKQYILYQEKQPPPFLLRSIHQNITTLQQQVEQADKYERQAIQAWIPFLSCRLGSLLASFSLSHNRRVPRQAIQLMSITAKYDFASMLKLASVFYCSGKFDKAEAILQTVEERFRSNDMIIICKCYDNTYRLPADLCHLIYTLRGYKRRAKLFAHCVRFSRHEIHCAPPALRHEMHRSLGDDIQYRDPGHDEWMVLAVVDCLPYLYYLQHLTYKQLGKRDHQRRSLQNLHRCVREDHDLRHLETAWNLLGQCLEDEQDPDASMACYRASLEIRPRNNAANWHIQNLSYKSVRKGCLPT